MTAAQQENLDFARLKDWLRGYMPDKSEEAIQSYTDYVNGVKREEKSNRLKKCDTKGDIYYGIMKDVISEVWEPVSVAFLKSKSRLRPIVIARYIVAVKLREDGFSQKEVSEMTGICRACIQRAVKMVESVRKNPKLDPLMAKAVKSFYERV